MPQDLCQVPIILGKLLLETDFYCMKIRDNSTPSLSMTCGDESARLSSWFSLHGFYFPSVSLSLAGLLLCRHSEAHGDLPWCGAQGTRGRSQKLCAVV